MCTSEVWNLGKGGRGGDLGCFVPCSLLKKDFSRCFFASYFKTTL